MAYRIFVILLHFFLCLKLQPLEAEPWIRAGYWYYGSRGSISDLDFSLFTHLICAFAGVNSSSYEISICSTYDQFFSSFTTTVKQKNPSITTLLSVGGALANDNVFSLMLSNASTRKNFINSSIRIAIIYGFQGLNFAWGLSNSSSDMNNIGKPFEEWREAAISGAKNYSKTELILTSVVEYSPSLHSTYFPVDSVRRNLNWVNVKAYNHYMPQLEDFTAAHSALYDPSGNYKPNTDSGINERIAKVLLPSQLVLGLPFFGYAWNLENPKDKAIGASATGPAVSEDGSVSYRDIKT